MQAAARRLPGPSPLQAQGLGQVTLDEALLSVASRIVIRPYEQVHGVQESAPLTEKSPKIRP